MQLDQAGDQVVAVDVDLRGTGRAGRSTSAMAPSRTTSVPRTSSSRVTIKPPPKRISLMPRLRIGERTRVATWSRTSASWKMPRIAAPARRASRDQPGHDGPAARVERCGGLVQQQHRMPGDEAARAMLTRCCSPPEKVAGGSAPEPLGDAAAGRACAGAPLERGVPRHPSARSGSATTSSAGTRGIDAQELADIAQRCARRTSSTARRRGHHVDALAAVPDPDAAGLGAVVAVEARSRVDLPARDGPASATHSPGATPRVTPRSTGSCAPPCGAG